MPQEIWIIDKFNRRRKALKGEVLQDGEKIHFSAGFMDAAHAGSPAMSSVPSASIRA